MSTFVYRNLGEYFLNIQIIGNLKLSERSRTDLEGAVIFIFRKFLKNFAYPNGAECKNILIIEPILIKAVNCNYDMVIYCYSQFILEYLKIQAVLPQYILFLRNVCGDHFQINSYDVDFEKLRWIHY